MPIRKKNNKKPNNNNNNNNINNTDQSNGFVFLNLTCSREEEEHYFEQEVIFPSTHDSAELMLYAFVDSSPSVADLLWSKQQLNQGEFLKLTDEQEWSEMPIVDFSTHEPRL